MLEGSQEGHTASIHVSPRIVGTIARQPRRELFEGSWTCRSPTFPQTLLNLGAIVARRKEDGSRSLGRSSDTVHYGAGNGREIEVEESRKSRGTHVE